MQPLLNILGSSAMLLVAAGTSITPQPLVIERGSQPLAGTLLETGGPLAILVAGSGPTDRDGNQAGMTNNALKRLAEALGEADISSFRYDKRGIGESRSDRPESELVIGNYAGDLAAIVRHFRTQNAARQVFFIGHSEGALISLLAAAEVSPAGVVSLAGAGRDAATVVLEQLAARASEAMVEQAREILAELAAGRPVTEVPANLMALLRPSVQPYLMSWLAHDPAELAGALEMPVLAVQGTSDLQITPRDACRLAEAGPHVRVALIEGMNHVLKPVSGGLADQAASYTRDELPLHEELVPILVDFVRGREVGVARCPADALQQPAAACARDPRFLGTWRGALQGLGLRLVFHVVVDADGCLAGRFDSPDQGGEGLPLSAVRVDGDVLVIEGGAFGFAYRGERSGEDSLTGTFSQGGQEFGLDLARD